ncbi:MAG: UvrB/UvrC motif-containing protein [Gemmatimonadota bacterium]|nr:UvrB/UvrC motif-containing protein [Gemmatimonadota bacterium]
MSDMVCSNCGATDAVVHLTQIVDNEMSTFHLCEKCAAEKGLESTPEPVSVPLTDFLAQMGQDEVEEPESDEHECSFCGLTFQQFRDSGRLGCPHCYETFAPALRRLLRRVHGGTQHVGKVYLPPDPSASEMEKRLEGLRRSLHRAIESEDFERAAELRDQIRSLEPA